MSKKYVIIGSGGQLGTELRKKYPEALAVDYPEIDITSDESLSKIDWQNYTTILNAAAWTDVDGAEKPENYERVSAINAKGPQKLAEIALGNNLTLFHISSDYVFDGKQKKHSETELFSPLSVYGETKAAGDQAIIDSGLEKYYIIRTSWVVGEGKNFIKTMFELAHRGIKPRVVNDQFGRLTFTSELVRAIDYIIKTQVEYGTYNVTDSGPIKNWYEIAADTYELAGFSRNDVTGISTDEYFAGKEFIAPRPINSDLDLSKIQATGFESESYEPLMEKYIETLKEGE